MIDLDTYVAGSNSRFLSTDILTEFRGCCDEIRIYLLSFSGFFAAIAVVTKDVPAGAVVGGIPAKAIKG